MYVYLCNCLFVYFLVDTRKRTELVLTPDQCVEMLIPSQKKTNGNDVKKTRHLVCFYTSITSAEAESTFRRHVVKCGKVK